MIEISLIGFGEVAKTCALAAGWGQSASAFDIAATGHANCPKFAAYDQSGVRGCGSNAEAVENSQIILSLVTADQALHAARTSALSIAGGACYFDMNSVAPDTKRAAAAAIEAAGGKYVDVAIMAPINPAKLDVPLLLSSSNAGSGATTLAALGFTNIRTVGNDVGRASSIKMIRSIMVKGQEALTAEMMLAADKAGVAVEVLASLGDSWAEKIAYNMERMQTHGARRAMEMEEVAKTISALGVEPLMTNGTIIRQREMAQMELKA